MPKYNQTVTDATIIADLSRRVRVLESAQRAATSGIAASSIAEDVKPVAYDSSSRTTAVTVVGGTTIDMPTVTVRGSLFLAVYSWLWTGVGGTAPFRSDFVAISVQIDGAPAGIQFAWESPSGSFLTFQPEQFIGTIEADPGEHTIDVTWVALANPSYTGLPSPIDVNLRGQGLVVIPLQLT